MRKVITLKILWPEIQFGSQKVPSQDLKKLSATAIFFKSMNIKVTNLEKEHIDITDGARAMDNLGETGEDTLQISAASSLQK